VFGALRLYLSTNLKLKLGFNDLLQRLKKVNFHQTSYLNSLFELIIRKEYKNKKQPQFKFLILNFLIESHFKKMSLKKVLENVAVSRNIKKRLRFFAVAK